MAKKRKRRTLLGGSDSSHQKDSIRLYESAENNANIARAAAQQGRCLKSLGSLKVAHDRIGGGDAHVSSTKNPGVAGRSRWGVIRAAAYDAVDAADTIFREKCVTRRP